MAALLGSCALSEQQQGLVLVNADRAVHQRRTLPPSRQLQANAQAQAQRMAASGRLFHSSAPVTGVTGCRASWGENVGVASSPDSVERALMNSPPHRANILNPAYDRVGIGMVRSRGKLWMVQIFMDRC